MKIIKSTIPGTSINSLLYQESELFIILNKIEKDNGLSLFFEPGLNKGLCSEFMLQLEKSKFIKINGKKVNDNKIVDFTNLEFTDKGREFYEKLKNSD
ncbi:MAG: hypothetical protein HZB41_03390 [Ignavibacteriae bacterium]|nr:hypothetical protein [Ignavibacteriota bacterium]